MIPLGKWEVFSKLSTTHKPLQAHPKSPVKAVNCPSAAIDRKDVYQTDYHSGLQEVGNLSRLIAIV